MFEFELVKKSKGLNLAWFISYAKLKLKLKLNVKLKLEIQYKYIIKHSSNLCSLDK